MARPRPDDAIRPAYDALGPHAYYQRHGRDYRNPHEPVIAELIGRCANEWPLDVSHVLDLAAGSGEVTVAVEQVARASRPCFGDRNDRPDARATRIDAIDPYTSAAYEARTGRPCERMSFEQIAAGGLRGRRYSLVVCSFALHLVEPSRLPVLCWALAGVAGQMLVLTPHKRPAIDPAWGWRLTHEILHRRVRARAYAVQPDAKGLS